MNKRSKKVNRSGKRVRRLSEREKRIWKEVIEETFWQIFQAGYVMTFIISIFCIGNCIDMENPIPTWLKVVAIITGILTTIKFIYFEVTYDIKNQRG